MREFTSLEQLQAACGQELGTSEWIRVDQDTIDRFAQATGDFQWIHCDPARAKQDSPYGTTIAHGFLTLALIPRLLGQMIRVPGCRMLLNYGLNRVRFPAAVPSGALVRMRAQLLEVKPLAQAAQLVLKCTFEVQGQRKPACVAEAVFRLYWHLPPEGSRPNSSLSESASAGQNEQ